MDLVRQRPAKSRWWIVYFVVLIVLATTGMVLPILYNLSQQLSKEQLDEARRTWEEKGPADYDLVFNIRYDRETSPEQHIVLVRGGQPVLALCEGEVLYAAPGLQAALGGPAAVNRSKAVDVSTLFSRMQEALDEETADGRRNFVVAVFNAKTGSPKRFIRRVRESDKREEWNVRVWPPGELPKTGP